MSYILRDKIPVPEPDILKWAKWFQDADRTVNRTEIDTDETVSTVFLGLDYNFFGGPPLLFETMVFGGKHDLYQIRYSTWEQAETGHNRIVEALLSGGLGDDDPE